MKRKIRLTAGQVLALGLISFLAACQSSDRPSAGSSGAGAIVAEDDLTPVVVQLDWIFNAQFAGFYQAIEQGYFEEAGLKVELRGGKTTDDVVESVLNEPAISFGSSESNVLLADAASGKDLRILGTMFQDSPMGWMYVRGGEIENFTDLADKRVGVHADGWRVIRLLLQEAGADLSGFETYDCGYDPQIVIGGEADAMQCYYIDEYVGLQELIGEQAGIFLAKDHGYEAYAQVIFTATETVAEHPEKVAGFLYALKRGWAYAFAHPEDTVELIRTKYSPELGFDYQLASLAKIEELMIPEPGALFRPVEAEVLEAGQERLLNYGLMDRELVIEDLLAQQFLPTTD